MSHDDLARRQRLGSGDRAKIEAGIKELNLGQIQILDADGRPKGLTP